MSDAVRCESVALDPATEELCRQPPRKMRRSLRRPICPVCNRPLVGAIEDGLVVLPPLKLRIFNLIKERPGISSRELAGLIYERVDRDALASIRVHINQIRELLKDSTDLWIASNGGVRGYWIEHSSAEAAGG